MHFSNKPPKRFNPLTVSPQEAEKYYAALTPAERDELFKNHIGPGLERNRIAAIGRGEPQFDFGQATVDAMRKITPDDK